MEPLLSQELIKGRINPTDDTALQNFFIRELKECVDHLASNFSKADDVILDDAPSASKLCFLVECILQYGMKEPRVKAFRSSYGFWEVVERLNQSLPGIESLLTNVKDSSKNVTARGRIFIRTALNEAALADMITALVWNQELLKSYYKDNALLRSESRATTLTELLERLKPLHFTLFPNDKDFEKPNYWSSISLPITLAEPPTAEILKSEPVRISHADSAEYSSGSSAPTSSLTSLTSPSSVTLGSAPEGSLDEGTSSLQKKRKKKSTKNRRVIEHIVETEPEEQHQEQKTAASMSPTAEAPLTSSSPTAVVNAQSPPEKIQITNPAESAFLSLVEISPPSSPEMTPRVIEATPAETLQPQPEEEQHVVTAEPDSAGELDTTDELHDMINDISENLHDLGLDSPLALRSPPSDEESAAASPPTRELLRPEHYLFARDSPADSKEDPKHISKAERFVSSGSDSYRMFQQMLAETGSASVAPEKEKEDRRRVKSAEVFEESSQRARSLSDESSLDSSFVSLKSRDLKTSSTSSITSNDSQSSANLSASFSIIEDYEPEPSVSTSKALHKVDSDFEELHSIRSVESPLMSAATILEPASFILEVPQKPAIGKGNKNCKGCNVSLGNNWFAQTPYCYYTGQYYCKNCHRGEKVVIPARVVQNWDRKEYSVSRESYVHIMMNYSRPMINIGTENPMLYEWDSSLNNIRKLRAQMAHLGEFIRTCRSCDLLLEEIGDRDYMMTSMHIFSLRDLVDCKNVLKSLYDTMEKYILHITQNCETCKGKGFFCEICNSKELLFGFQFATTVKCPNCSTVFHRACLKQGEGIQKCPKCERIKKIRGK
eukprot:TRINITY_DN4159_c0_g2_i1.p1 TRINITY_DN4159_c0_g2~~TRINITY_DN4159_c0_g2_i1.p1  ORF type:complete len:836 (+),score=150.92 TRINITY_DN4159_c0_g2_i1:187-2694(+)